MNNVDSYFELHKNNDSNMQPKSALESYKNNENTLFDTLSFFNMCSSATKKTVGTNNNSQFSHVDFAKCTIYEREAWVNFLNKTLATLVIHRVNQHNGDLIALGGVFKYMMNNSSAGIDKKLRKVVYSTSQNLRPVKAEAYNTWNGLQIFDLDIKDFDIAKRLKQILFDKLNKYTWFLGVSTSSSGAGLHVWTKINVGTDYTVSKEAEFICNYRHKYSFIYLVLREFATELGYTEDDILKYMDMAMCKPQQGIFLAHDEDILLSTNFVDETLPYNVSASLNDKYLACWLNDPVLEDVFKKHEWFSKDNTVDDISIENVVFDADAECPVIVNNKRHYKHAQRWQLANTLTALYGASKALVMMMSLCPHTPKGELAGDVKTAQTHNKPVSKWAIKELNNQFGLEIRYNDTTSDETLAELAEKINNAEATVDPTRIVTDNMASNKVELHLSSTQYLSDIKDDIIKNLGKITLIEAGAGYGKTEMVKRMGGRVLMVLPFTSTIKSKIEADPVLSEEWLYYYGSKKPSFDDFLDTRKSMVMTPDKFANVSNNIIEYSNFDYIVLDESHLLFTSSYRPVMATCLEKLTMSQIPVIIMTGTPTGEMTFLQGIKHIRVQKEDNRIKKFDTTVCYSKNEQLVELTKAIAEDIKAGRKILFPTNKGETHVAIITSLVQQCLEADDFGRKLNMFYYKKSNYGEESMDDINFSQTVGDNDIIFCTNYLSVGVDIKDKGQFSVYFDEMWIAQDIEQFANRLRGNDLYVKLFLPGHDADGFAIDYNKVQKLKLDADREDVLFARDIIQACNEMIKRNGEEYRFNPIIRNLVSANNFIKYNEQESLYYINITGYKLNIFEERYSIYAKQYPVLASNMRYFGYEVNITYNNNQMTEDKVDQLNEFIAGVRSEMRLAVTSETFTLLDHMTEDNIEYYFATKKGDLDIFKLKKYDKEREQLGLYNNRLDIIDRNGEILKELYKEYSIDTIKDIYKHSCGKNGLINFTKLNRIVKLVRIEAARKSNKLDVPVWQTYNAIKGFIKENEGLELTRDEFKKKLDQFSCDYANSIKGIAVADKKFLKKIREYVKEMFMVICEIKKGSNKTVTLSQLELEWHSKHLVKDTYAGTDVTKDFFLDSVIGELINLENDNKEDKIAEIEGTLGYHVPAEKVADVPDTVLTTIVPTTYAIDKLKAADNSIERLKTKETIDFEKNYTIYKNIKKYTALAAVDTPDTEKEPNLFACVAAI